MLKKIPFLLILLVISCSNSNESDNINKGNIDFEFPEIGQISVYQKAFGENYIDKTINSYDLLNTFLNVEITSIRKDTIYIKESIQDSVNYTYAFKISNDTLNLFKPNSMFLDSHLFGSHFQNYKISLRTNSSNYIEFLGWKTSTNFCECYLNGYTKNFNPFGKEYDSLLAIVDEREMAIDKFGYNFLFSINEGIVLSSKIISWRNTGEVWFLRPNN